MRSKHCGCFVLVRKSHINTRRSLEAINTLSYSNPTSNSPDLLLKINYSISQNNLHWNTGSYSAKMLQVASYSSPTEAGGLQTQCFDPDFADFLSKVHEHATEVSGSTPSNDCVTSDLVGTPYQNDCVTSDLVGTPYQNDCVPSDLVGSSSLTGADSYINYPVLTKLAQENTNEGNIRIILLLYLFLEYIFYFTFFLSYFTFLYYTYFLWYVSNINNLLLVNPV